MNSPFHEDLILSYLEGKLSASELEEFEQRLQADPEFKRQVEESRELWESIGELPQPEKNHVQRFQSSLEAFKQEIEAVDQLREAEAEPEHPNVVSIQTESRWFRFFQQPSVYAASLAFFFVGGVLTTLSIGKVFVNDEKPVESNSQILALQQEVSDLKEMTILAMLQQTESSDRLKGVNWVTYQQPEHISPRLLDALFKTVLNDGNTGVRLAAVDALKGYASDPTVRDRVILELPQIDSDFVQIELIKLLARFSDAQMIPAMQAFIDDEEENPTVREMAALTLQQMERAEQSQSRPRGI